MSSPRFTWGDSVVVRSSAPAHFRPGAVAAVVGTTEVTPRLAAELGASVGSIVYTIEHGDGSDALVAEDLLERFEE